MDDLEEFESWHNDLMAWERFHNEIERIEEEENTSGDLHDINENDIFCYHGFLRNLTQKMMSFRRNNVRFYC